MTTAKDVKEVAFRLFAQKGYENTTMREIGKGCGIRGASLYTHFESKEAIFLLLVDDLRKKLVLDNEPMIAEILESRPDSYKEVLCRVFKKQILYFSENRLELQFWERARYLPLADRIKQFDVSTFLFGKSAEKVFYVLFERAVALKLLKQMEASVLATSFFNYLTGYCDSITLYDKQYSEEELGKAFEIFWNGIKYD